MLHAHTTALIHCKSALIWVRENRKTYLSFNQICHILGLTRSAEWRKIPRDEVKEMSVVLEDKGKVYRFLMVPVFRVYEWIRNAVVDPDHLAARVTLETWVRFRCTTEHSVEALVGQILWSLDEMLRTSLPVSYNIQPCIQAMLQNKEKLAAVESEARRYRKTLERLCSLLGTNISNLVSAVKELMDQVRVLETLYNTQESTEDPVAQVEEPKVVPETTIFSVEMPKQGEVLIPTVARKKGFLSAKRVVEELLSRYEDGHILLNEYYTDYFKVRKCKNRKPKSLSVLVKIITKHLRIYPEAQEGYEPDSALLYLTQSIPLKISVEKGDGIEVKELKRQVTYSEEVVDRIYKYLVEHFSRGQKY